MKIITAKPKNKTQLKALKAFAKALKVEYSIEKPYNKKFVKKILKSQKQMKEGKGVEINVEDMWK